MAMLGQRLILRQVDRQKNQVKLYALSDQPSPIIFELALARFGFRLHLDAEYTQIQMANYEVRPAVGNADFAPHHPPPMCVWAGSESKQRKHPGRIVLAAENPGEPVRVSILASSLQPPVRTEFQLVAQRVADARIQLSLGLLKQAAKTLRGNLAILLRGIDHPAEGFKGDLDFRPVANRLAHLRPGGQNRCQRFSARQPLYRRASPPPHRVK